MHKSCQKNEKTIFPRGILKCSGFLGSNGLFINTAREEKLPTTVFSFVSCILNILKT